LVKALNSNKKNATQIPIPKVRIKEAMIKKKMLKKPVYDLKFK